MNAHVRFSAAQQRAMLNDELAGRFPDARGRFGPYGGRYVPETLIPALERLEAGMREHLHREDFQREFIDQLRHWVGRPTALSHAPRLSEAWGADIWFNARISRIPAHIKSTTQSVRPCSPSDWAPSVSLRRRALASMASRALPPVRDSVCPVSSTWAQSIWNAKRRMSGVCVCSVPRSYR